MIAIVVCVAIALGCANGQAAKYPAGVNPHLCPNYPHCDNAVLGAAASAAGSAAHAYSAPVYGGYAAPGYAAPAYAASGHAAVAAVGYPADVNPHSCPNYPYCGPTPVHVPSKVWTGPAAHGYAAPAVHGYAATAHNAWAAPAAYAHGGAAGYGFSSLAKGGDRYPAGVSPHACPNYPYCH